MFRLIEEKRRKLKTLKLCIFDKKRNEMTKVQTIIEEISHLSQEELEMILGEILNRLDRKDKIESILGQYIGIGEGVWGEDAQGHVNELREERA